MSEINSQALREAAERAIPAMERLLILSFDDELLSDQELKDYDVDIDAINNFKLLAGPINNFKLLAGPKTVLALLDERERNQQYIKRRDQENEEIALTVGKLRVDLEAAEKRNAKLQSENAYIRNRYKELDLLIGKNILVMQAAIIEWQATGDAKSGLAWIYNTLFGPGELPDESEKDAQAYFNRKYAPIDEKLMELHKWFWEQSEAERAAGIRIKGD
ncbi:ead/Ea22-like family protein [Escherichia coli]